MIQYGRKVKRNQEFDYGYRFYALEKSGIQKVKPDFIYLSNQKSMDYYIEELQMENILYQEIEGAYKIMATKEFTFMSQVNVDKKYYDGWKLIQNKKIKIANWCEICKNRTRKLVTECIEKTTYSEKLKCDFEQDTQEQNINLLGLYEVPFTYVYHRGGWHEDYKDSCDFNVDNLEDKRKYNQRKAKTRRLKKLKKEKYCSNCIFRCEDRLITTENVNTHCMLTYKQALESGFFKDIKLLNSTSIYRQGVYIGIKSDKHPTWHNEVCRQVALKESKYHKKESENEHQ